MTPRQEQVAALICHGMTNKMIGRHLGISEGTVKVHLAKVMRELGVSNRTKAAVIIAQREQ